MKNRDKRQFSTNANTQPLHYSLITYDKKSCGNMYFMILNCANNSTPTECCRKNGDHCRRDYFRCKNSRCVMGDLKCYGRLDDNNNVRNTFPKPFPDRCTMAIKNNGFRNAIFSVINFLTIFMIGRDYVP